jgi:DNA-binding response OmpR family regulator
MLQSAYEREVVSLRNQLSDAQAELRALRRRIIPRVMFPRAWGLRPGECRVLASLYNAPRGYRHKSALLVAASPTKWQECTIKNVEVYIHHLRRKVAAQELGIEIITHIGDGYQLTKESKKFIQRAIGATA